VHLRNQFYPTSTFCIPDACTFAHKDHTKKKKDELVLCSSRRLCWFF